MNRIQNIVNTKSKNTMNSIAFIVVISLLLMILLPNINNATEKNN
jgi:uncharacterized membrane protein YadS